MLLCDKQNDLRYELLFFWEIVLCFYFKREQMSTNGLRRIYLEVIFLALLADIESYLGLNGKF